MSLYPSLEDMKVDMMMRAQASLVTETHAQPKQIQEAASLSHPSTVQGFDLYPALGNYMGLELSSEEIALNMPEYQLQQMPTTTMGQIAPITSQSLMFEKSAVKQGIRPVVLCKDKEGKVGLRLRSINDGVFVCYVADGSPAALGGLRFGDQVLEINGAPLAGMSMEKAHDMLKKAPVNGIALIVRDRPFERTLTLHRDSVGCYGFKLKDGCIVSLVQGSSAARNGLLTDHQLLEVDSRNVVGLKDKEVAALLQASPAVINITVVPSFIYKHMIKKMSTSLLRESMDRTPAV